MDEINLLVFKPFHTELGFFSYIYKLILGVPINVWKPLNIDVWIKIFCLWNICLTYEILYFSWCPVGPVGSD